MFSVSKLTTVCAAGSMKWRQLAQHWPDATGWPCLPTPDHACQPCTHLPARSTRSLTRSGRHRHRTWAASALLRCPYFLQLTTPAWRQQPHVLVTKADSNQQTCKVHCRSSRIFNSILPLDRTCLVATATRPGHKGRFRSAFLSSPLQVRRTP